MSRPRSLPRARDRHDARSRPGNARKRLSQNFLTDAGIAALIVRTSGVGSDDLVLEIGPGDGMLTRQLLRAAGHVLAYEKDAHYAARLRERYANNHRIRCYQADFRTIHPPHEPFAVVANIPFSATTDIVRWCLSARHLTSATLLTQREFARKHTGDYGRWTKLAITYWPTTTLELGPRIDRRSFHPIPRVDSALLHLRRRTHPLLEPGPLANYRQLVALGFSGVGGSLANSLSRAHPPRKVRAACALAGIGADQPVGLVPPDQWLMLYRALT